jgi:hypothetical protein
MAKLKPSSTTPLNTVVDGMMISVPALGSVTYKQANNNLKTRPGNKAKMASGVSAAFQNLDAQIRSLDAQYDMLADPLAWTIYASNIVGDWDLCANCEPGPSGKKLYRQVNYNRALLGLAQLTLPIDDEEYAEGDQIYLTYQNYPGPGYPLAGIVTFYAVLPIVVFAQVGRANANPLLELTSANTGIDLFSGPAFDWVQQVCTDTVGLTPAGGYAAQDIKGCICTPDGAPGHQQTISVGVFYAP